MAKRHSKRTLKFYFHGKFKIDPESGCWLWTSYRDKAGYGQVRVGRRMSLAHRRAWEIARGEIPDGLCVLHRCDTPSCVNVDHLWLGTYQDNADDMWAKRRGNPACGDANGSRKRRETRPRGIDHWKAKLTDEAVRHIARREMSGRDYARLYSVSKSAVKSVWSGRTWSSVTGLQKANDSSL